MAERIEQKRLAEHIVEDLEKRIIDGVFRPGERIDEEALCKVFAVSRTPLKEALQILENRGFLVREPRRGIFVAQVTPQEIEDIYRIRASLEGLAMSLAVQHRTPELLGKLKKLHDKMVKVAGKSNDRCYQKLNLRFHETIVGACGNPRLIELIRTFDKQTTRYRVAVMVAPGWIENSARIHRAVIAAFEAGDDEAAEGIRRGVVLNQSKRFSEIFNNKEGRNEDRS